MHKSHHMLDMHDSIVALSIMLNQHDLLGVQLMELVDARQVSAMTGVPVGTLRYWRHADLGPASFTLGRRVVYRREEVLRWIRERETATRRGGGAA
jgi:predicted DNA-binding transcriptional regulator AlpA